MPFGLVWSGLKAASSLRHSKRQLVSVTNGAGRRRPPAQHTYVLLQPGLADVREAEGEERLPRPHVQHVVLLAEQQRRVIEDAVHGEPLGGPLPGIWKEQQSGRRIIMVTQRDGRGAGRYSGAG